MNDSELKELLEENLRVSKESLAILKKTRSDALWRRFFTAIKWLIVLGLLVWGYIQLQPILDQLLGVWQNVTGLTEQLQNLKLPQIPDFK